MLAQLTKAKEFEIDLNEAKLLAGSATNLQRFYNIQVTDKALAWSNFGMALMTVYGTRLSAIAIRQKTEARNAGQSSNIIRPAAFHRPTVVMPEAAVATPSDPAGDPVAAQPNAVAPKTPGDAAFAATPPEMI